MTNFEKEEYLKAITHIDAIFGMSVLDDQVEILAKNGGLFLLTQYMLKHPDCTIRRIACNTFS